MENKRTYFFDLSEKQFNEANKRLEQVIHINQTNAKLNSLKKKSIVKAGALKPLA